MRNKMMEAYEKNETLFQRSQHVDVMVTADNEKKNVQVVDVKPIRYSPNASTFSIYLERNL